MKKCKPEHHGEALGMKLSKALADALDKPGPVGGAKAAGKGNPGQACGNWCRIHSPARESTSRNTIVPNDRLRHCNVDQLSKPH